MGITNTCNQETNKLSDKKIDLLNEGLKYISKALLLDYF